MSNFQLAKYNYFFKILDVNQNTYIQDEDFSELAERIRVILDYEEGSKEHKRIISKAERFFQKLVRDINPLDAEKITEKELSDHLISVVIKDEVELDSFKEVVFNFMFDFFDQNHDGFISKEEYGDFYTIFGIDKQHFESSFNKLDNSKTGRFNRYDLLSAVEEYFTADNEENPGNWVFGDWSSQPLGQ